MNKVSVLSLLFVLTASAFAGAAESPYYQLTMKQLPVVEDTTAYPSATPIGSESCAQAYGNNMFGQSGDWAGNPIDLIDVTLDKIINIGKKVWAIMEKGHPVFNLKVDVATALPQGAKCWMDLQTWKAPKSYKTGVVYENGFGAEVVRLDYRIVYVAGGSVDGQGKYIGYATVVPVDVYIAWGFNLDVAARVPTVFNMGTKADPVGGMQMDVNWKINTISNYVEQTDSFSLDGAGALEKLD